MTHQITIKGEALPVSMFGTPYFWFDSLTGIEKINELFEYQLIVKIRDEYGNPAHGYMGLEGYISPEQAKNSGTPASDLNLQSLIGTELTICMRLDGLKLDISQLSEINNFNQDHTYQNSINGARYFRGMVNKVEVLPVRNRHACYKITLVPWLWLLTKTTNYRIYQDESVTTILEDILLKYPYPVEEYDGHIKTVTTTNGKFENIYVKNHEKGLKVYFKNIKGDFDLIADHKKLPTGKKVIRLTSRMIKVKGSTHVKDGTKQYTVKDILSDLKKIGQPVLDGLGKVLGGAEENVKNKDIPKATDQQVRTDEGNKTHVVSFQFTEDNFLLTPINNVYRAHIITSAKKYGLTPHALAALINAEAAKTKQGQWNANSEASSSSATGLTQFLNATWLEVANDKSTLVGKYKNENPTASEEKILNLRFKPDMAIDAAAAYAIKNFKQSGLSYQKLKEPSSIAKLAYLLHHEGAGGGKSFVNNTISEERSKKLLYAQFGKDGQKTADGYIKKYGSAKVAYIEWLSTYINTKISVLHYVPNSEKTSLTEVSMQDTIKVLKGDKSSAQTSTKNQTVEKQNNTTQAKLEETKQKTVVKNSTQLPETTPAVGGSNTWCDPLVINKLRTAGLQSVKSATFGKVRNGGTTNHQGIDLAANVGTDVYAVCHGIVSYAGDSGGAYGKVVILSVDKNDLPLKQRNYVSKFIKNDEVFFFYAHLSSIFVSSTNIIDAKTVVGKTGDTGNAKGMTTIAKGGHLHFEVRSAKNLGKGLIGRFDPIPLFLTKLL